MMELILGSPSPYRPGMVMIDNDPGKAVDPHVFIEALVSGMRAADGEGLQLKLEDNWWDLVEVELVQNFIDPVTHEEVDPPYYFIIGRCEEV